MLERELSQGVLTVRLAYGKASALDLEFCDALQRQFEDAAADDEVRAVVVTGRGAIFSGGVDLPRLVEGGAAYVHRFLPALETMLRSAFELPKPLVAAINGHAIAGGAIVAFAADYRIMSGGRIGVPELLVGVPFPPLAWEIVRFVVPPRFVQPLVYFGSTLEPEQARERGLVDEVAGPEQLLARASEVARQLAAVDPEVFLTAKRRLREPAIRQGEQIAAARGGEIVRIWAAPATLERVRAWVAKTLKKERPVTET